jgi:2-polyprenyl-6-methoxyphenol hydroxylase-like FAD-dependent oxidoreductase
MRIVSIGGGPAGLYFAILMKQADPSHDIVVVERNRADDTFGFGVVFSDATLDNFQAADRESHAAIIRAFAHWDDIDTHYAGQTLRSTGHGFAGMSRQTLLTILQQRCAALGVTLRFSSEVDDLARYADADLLLAADGANSWVRTQHADRFGPRVDWRPNRFVWLGTTFPFPAFTFLFKEDEHGLWRVHAYRYNREHSTFILETTEATWRRAGLDQADEAVTAAFAERLFARELDGHRILTNRSLWRQFPTVRNARWHDGRVVLVGDAAHTAHFSIGSGTKLAMEDVIALAHHVRGRRDVRAALADYEAERRPMVEALQRAAQTSLEWFEGTERYYGRLEPLQFAYSLLTRSLRVSHENLRTRDPRLVAAVERWLAERAGAQSGRVVLPGRPLSMPLRLRDVVLDNRLVAEAPPTSPYFGLVLASACTSARPPRARSGLRLTQDFAAGARAAAEAGVDLLEVDVADDPKAALHAFDAARSAWPMARPIMVRIDAGGNESEADALVELARVLAARGCDMVSIAVDYDPAAELTAIALSDRIRHEAGIATLVSAGVDTRPDADSVIAAGRADLCLIRASRAPSLASAMQQPLWS